VTGPRSSRDDSGESLIEILLSIMILGIAVAALLFGMTTAASTAGLNARQTQQAETVRNAVAALQALPYVKCTSSPSYSVPAALVPTGFTVTSPVTGFASGPTFSGSCPGTGDQGAQRLVVTVTTTTDTRVRAETATVIKRNPCVAASC